MGRFGNEAILYDCNNFYIHINCYSVRWNFVVFNFCVLFFFVYIISSCLVVALMTFVARCYLAKN